MDESTSDTGGDVQLPKVPRDTAGWLLYIFGELRDEMRRGFDGIRGTLNNLDDRVTRLEDERDARLAVGKNRASTWKVVGALVAGAASISLIIEVILTTGVHH